MKMTQMINSAKPVPLIQLAKLGTLTDISVFIIQIVISKKVYLRLRALKVQDIAFQVQVH